MLLSKTGNVLKLISHLGLSTLQVWDDGVAGNDYGLLCASLLCLPPTCSMPSGGFQAHGEGSWGRIQNAVAALSFALSPTCFFNILSLPYPLMEMDMEKLRRNYSHSLSFSHSLSRSVCNLGKPNSCRVEYNSALLFCLYYTLFSVLGTLKKLKWKKTNVNIIKSFFDTT